ncbi:MAG: type II toxin-antitoxin system RelE/ParE family toxin [Alphaproteobacteria bacterium]|nr:type II toxin-antitoxin system RelE/ParE family toxin [Alphaproteobacteria bacterium]
MSAIVVFHRLAAREYRESREWYAARSPSVAERFRISVDGAVARVAEEGERLPVLSGPYRWVRVRRFPYLLVFRRRTSNQIMIVAVAHTSRRPGYWRRRV